jgi:DNA-binding XRE family transcriptional regulator
VDWSADEVEQARRQFYDDGAPSVTIWGYMALDVRISAATFRLLSVMSIFAARDQLILSQRELAIRIGVTQQAVSKLLRQAEAEGYVQKLTIDTKVHWRLRWLIQRRPQPVVVRPQPEVVGPQPEVVTRTHALSPVLNSSSGTEVKDGKARKPKTEPLTVEQRAKLHEKYVGFYPSAQALDDVIDASLEHENARKWKTEYRYAMGWVQRDIRDRKLFNTNLKAAEARLAKAKGEPTHNPLVSEKPAWLGKSIWEIEAANPSRDRTHD